MYANMNCERNIFVVYFQVFCSNRRNYIIAEARSKLPEKIAKCSVNLVLFMGVKGGIRVFGSRMGSHLNSDLKHCAICRRRQVRSTLQTHYYCSLEYYKRF